MGALADIRSAPSASFGPRRDGVTPDMIVLHYTAMTSAEAALARLCDPAVEVSAHYLIGEDGTVWQMVAEAMRAWHAGAGCWGAVTDVNSRSIGIELANCGDHPFPEPQMAALERLLAGIRTRWPIVPERIIGHSDMAPGRKIDPGPRFDWRRLARQGLGVWPGDDLRPGGDLSQFTALARDFGYCADVPSAEILAAFRLRFRPWKRGAPDLRDLAIIRDLARRYPVDRARDSA
ncbi:N-acetylmuramoyl-L-alanine amidase [Shimia sp.]|uniref:N-acetylmuramoyl-L-alanine amidase n=1 Tax=Shimia sp. TaxID=1954381 RepID=UPI0035670C60